MDKIAYNVVTTLSNAISWEQTFEFFIVIFWSSAAMLLTFLSGILPPAPEEVV